MTTLRSVSPKPPRILAVSAWVLFYGMSATLLVAIGMALSMGWLAWSTTRELRGLQSSLLEARGANRVCRTALTRCDAKLEVVDEWILGAKKLR